MGVHSSICRLHLAFRISFDVKALTCQLDGMGCVAPGSTGRYTT